MATDTGSGHLAPRQASAVSTAGLDRSAGQPRAAARSHRVALLLIGLSYLRSRPVIEAAIIAAVGVAAVAGLARENQTKNWGRLAAWLNRQSQRYERPIKAA
jgi:hypothetical protein